MKLVTQIHRHFSAFADRQEIRTPNLVEHLRSNQVVGDQSGMIDRVNKCNDTAIAKIRFCSCCIRNPTRIGDPAGFDHQHVRARLAVEHIAQCHEQIATDAATDAAIGQRNRILILRFKQIRIDIDRSEIIDQHREAAPARRPEQTVNQRSFARPEVTADDDERERFVSSCQVNIASQHRSKNRYVPEGRWIDAGRVVTKHGEVRPLPAFDRTDFIIEFQGIGRPQRNGVKSLFN